MDRKDEKGVVVAGRLTKLPSIRGLSFASRRPAGVGLAGIASIHFHHVSLLFAPRPMFVDSFPIRYSSKCSCWHAWRQVFGGLVREVKESWGRHLPEDLGCIHHIAGEDSLAEEGSRRRS